MRKNIFVNLGLLTTAITPIAVVVSCGTNVSSGVAFTKSDNLIQFSLNTPKSNLQFMPFAINNKLSSNSLQDLNKAIHQAMLKNNTLKTKFGEKISFEITYVYDEIITDDPNTIGDKIIKHNGVIKVSIILAKLSNSKNIFKKAPFEFKDNIILELLKKLSEITDSSNGNKSIVRTDLSALSSSNTPNIITLAKGIIRDGIEFEKPTKGWEK